MLLYNVPVMVKCPQCLSGYFNTTSCMGFAKACVNLKMVTKLSQSFLTGGSKPVNKFTVRFRITAKVFRQRYRGA